MIPKNLLLTNARVLDFEINVMKFILKIDDKFFRENHMRILDIAKHRVKENGEYTLETYKCYIEEVINEQENKVIYKTLKKLVSDLYENISLYFRNYKPSGNMSST